MKNLKIKKHKGKAEKMTPDLTIVRGLPNFQFTKIGSIVLLDHMVERTFLPTKPKMPDGSFEHPHRGIATFTYVLKGELHHLDSNGGEGIVSAGGIQWMNSGNGITHDEFVSYNFQEKGGILSAFQFWLNLPAEIKAKKPEYLAVQSSDISEVKLSNDSGKLRILLGGFEEEKSAIPNYLDQILYHVTLKAGKSFQLPTNQDWEYALYPIKGSLNVNDQFVLEEKEMTEISHFEENLILSNESLETIDFLIIGGETYKEQMVSYGPFIMNTQEEIAQAYSDYHHGEYGKVDYSKVKI